MAGNTLLTVSDLQVHFFLKRGTLKPVDGVNFSISEGETLGIVGESGCGKTVTALSILRLIPDPPARIVGGRIEFEDDDLVTASQTRMRKLRGNEISMIFQEPMTSLNPVFRVGHQIAQAVRLHQGLSKKEALNKAIEVLRLVGIPSPEKRVHDYPHQLSGGMRQRVMIAMAASCQPKLMIADEPTTALDVTIQAQILDLMQQLKEEIGTSIILITHDQGVIAENAERVLVMYAGKVVESAPVTALFEEPCHPYTVGLLKAVPGTYGWDEKGRRLYVIPGMVPSPLGLPPGCRFEPRCQESMPRCRVEEPSLLAVSDNHLVRCWKYQS